MLVQCYVFTNCSVICRGEHEPGKSEERRREGGGEKGEGHGRADECERVREGDGEKGTYFNQNYSQKKNKKISESHAAEPLIKFHYICLCHSCFFDASVVAATDAASFFLCVCVA